MKTGSRLVLLFALGMALAGAASMMQVAAADGGEAVATQLGMMAVGAGIAIGLPGLGAGIGLSIATSAIAAAGAERPEIIGRFFIFIVFIEAIAIYGLIVAVFIIMMLPSAVA